MEIRLGAPLSGWAMPLSEVPDPVFSQGLAGPGWAIDPTESCLYSPCAGQVVTIHRCRHALTLRSDEGLEILLHVGVDTVQLQGDGFRALVETGARVRAGQPLLEFDSDRIARRCRSLVTVLLIPESSGLEALEARSGAVQHGAEWMTLRWQAADSPAADTAPEQLGSWLELPNPAGMHARPAARLAGLVRAMAPAQFWLESEQRRASALSLVGLLNLGLVRGDRVRLVARGASPKQLEELERELRAGLGDDLSAPVEGGATAPRQSPATAPPDRLVGVVASPGLAIGQVVHWTRRQFVLPEQAADPDREQSAWRDAWQRAQAELAALRARAPASEAAIFAAHEELLRDPELLQAVEQALQAGRSAARAWHDVYTASAESLRQLGSPLLAERAGDVLDVGERVLALLLGVEAGPRALPENSVVIARDLTPSDIMQLDRSHGVGLCLAAGGPTSHVAILARSLGLPTLCAVGEDCLQLAEGTSVILDAERGELRAQPAPAELEHSRQRQAAAEQQRCLERQQAQELARTRDGQEIEVAVNIGGPEEARSGLAWGADGVGLFRTEFFFHEQPSEPALQAQQALYRQVASVLGPERRLVARLLDVGGDKPLPYLGLAPEANPFLGMRGIRLLSTHRELFVRQVEALLSVAGQTRLALLVPMVSGLGEWLQVKQLVTSLYGSQPIELGVMIEVPSAALLAEKLAPHVDFFSVETNDLTQYTLAMDRGHPQLASQVDALHPAVLQLLARVGDAARAQGRWLGVCGGAAGEVEAVPILLGLGVTELSVSGPSVAAIKAEVRRWELEECRRLARQALGCAEAAEVRELVRAARQSLAR